MSKRLQRKRRAESRGGGPEGNLAQHLWEPVVTAVTGRWSAGKPPPTLWRVGPL